MGNIKERVYVTWIFNKFCNFNCPFCFHEEKIRKNPALIGKSNINKIVNFFNQFKKNSVICMTGGEPFLFPNFIELCKRLTKRHYISIMTNLSSELIYQFAEEIDPRRIKRIQVSFHITEINRLNLKKNIIENYKLLKRKGFPMIPIIIMWPPILKNFKKIYKEFENESIYLIPYSFKGVYIGKKYPDFYTKKEIKTMKKYHQYSIYKTSGFLEKNYIDVSEGAFSFRGFLCNAGKNSLAIDHKGNIQRCLSDNKKLGNIYKGDVKLLKKPAVCSTEICDCHWEGINNSLGKPKIIKIYKNKPESKLKKFIESLIR